MASFTDPAGCEIRWNETPARLVSISPSLTELLCDLGLDAELLAVSNQCSEPKVRVRNKPKAGDAAHPDVAMIRYLHPDLVFAGTNETAANAIGLLRTELRVWEARADTLKEAARQIRVIGEMTGKEASANWLADKIETRFAELRERRNNAPRLRTVYFREPVSRRVAGAATLTGEILATAGLVPACAGYLADAEPEEAYLKSVRPDLVLLPACSDTGQEQALHHIKVLFPEARYRFVRQDLLEWYGSRLLRAPAYLEALCGELDGAPPAR